MKYELEGAGVVELKKLNFELIKRGDLIFFEGPVLSHFIDERGDDYFMHWCEIDDSANRWLLLQVTKEQMSKHLSGKTSLLSLIKKTESGAVYFLDIDDDIEYNQIKYVEVGSIPDQYLPGKDSFFEMKYATVYARQIESEIKELLYIRKHSHSFLETATVELFGKNSSRLKHFNRHEQFFLSADSPSFYELHAVNLMTFPLLISLHAEKKPGIEELFEKYIGVEVNRQFCRLWLMDACFAVSGHSLDSDFNIVDVSGLVDIVITNAEKIVFVEPKRYSKLWNIWKKNMAENWSHIYALDTVFRNKLMPHETNEMDDVVKEIIKNSKINVGRKGDNIIK